jgi:predicted nucleic acid-binding protein
MTDLCFIDSNVLIYLLSADEAKADKAEAVISRQSIISVQVLNELTHVARRKLKMPWQVIEEFLDSLRGICTVEPLTLDTHIRALAIAKRYQISFFDALIVAAALLSNCTILYSEDMQHGMKIDSGLVIKNPFSPK